MKEMTTMTTLLMPTYDTVEALKYAWFAAILARTDAILTYGELSAVALGHGVIAENAYNAYREAVSVYAGWRVSAQDMAVSA
jgi:hypothetical protein